MNQKLLGLLRSIGYPVLFFAISTFISTFSTSGVVDVGTATVITGVVGLLEHSLADYLGYNLPAGFGKVKQ